jgi:hypothetical protein
MLRATKEANLATRASECKYHIDSLRSGLLTTIEPMTMRPARIATRPSLAKHRRASA